MKKYRNEWKFVCTNGNLELLKSRISKLVYVDSNSKENGKYYIHSLYFDDYKDTCLRAVEAGTFERMKWRIRYYNDSNKDLFLEKKEKLFGRCHKRKCKISVNEFNAILKRRCYECILAYRRKTAQRIYCRYNK